MKEYLESSEYVNWRDDSVYEMAQSLAFGKASEEAVAKSCFNFVRDEIKHSHDFGLNPVTIKASQVLEYRTGYCYSKSHLLSALLRANGIPSALCYQRLSVDGDSGPYCLHGLNAVYLARFGWYRMDARGKKQGVDAQFVPPEERLAFREIIAGEFSLGGLFSEPLPEIVDVLERFSCESEVWQNLPDLPKRLNKTW